MTKIGVAGNSLSFYEEGHSSTIEAAKWCADRKIDIFEYSFGKGITVSDVTAQKIGREFKCNGVEISIHAPYYINFANPEREAIEKNFGYVIRSLEKLSVFDNGERIVFHPATQGKVSREEAVSVAKRNLIELADVIKENGLNKYKTCIETMGKIAQIGTVEEVTDFCNIADFFYPCVDFGHINARTHGSLKTAEDYENIIKYMFDNLAETKVKNMHVHFSKVMYGKGGEIKHLTFKDTEYGPEFEPLAEIFVKYDMSPVIICESSGTQAEDAMTMRRIYDSVKKSL